MNSPKERGRGPWHGLPVDVWPPVPVEWPDVIHYICTLAEAGQPVRVWALATVGEFRMDNGTHVFTVGALGLSGRSTLATDVLALSVGPVDTRYAGGYVELQRASFVDGDLSTHDGDDYFSLNLKFENLTIHIEDMNST